MNKWPIVTLQQVCTRITDGSHASPPTVMDGLPMASVKDLTRYGIKLESCRRISQCDFDKLVRQGCRPEKGDVLIAKDGATALETVCVVEHMRDVVLLSSVAILRPDPNEVSTYFLRYLLDADTTRAYMRSAFTTGAAITRVVLKDFKRAQIHKPPLLVQRKITAILSAYDDLIENNTRRIKILEEMAQTLYREWFVHFRFPGHEKSKMVESEMGMIPDGWAVRLIADVADVNANNIRSSSAPETIHYVDITSVSTGRVDQTTEMKYAMSPGRARRLVLHGDVIWSCVRPNRRSYSLILRPVKNMVASTGFAVLTTRSVPYTFLYQCVTTDEFVSYLNNRARGAAYPAVTGDDFATATLLVPSPELLTSFHRAMESMCLQTSVLERKNNVLRATRDLLLPKLISGEVDVADLDIETLVPA